MKTPTELAWEELCSAPAPTPTPGPALVQAPAPKLVHPFTLTLGEGPFKFINTQGGATKCAHCGTRITNLYMIANGAGEVKPVGSECVLKLNDYTLVCAVKAAKRKWDRQKREERKAKKEAEALEAGTKLAREQHPNELAFLEAEKVGSGFFASLYNQLIRNGSLSEKQMACIHQAILKKSAPPAPKVFSLKVGSTLIVTKFYARIIGAETGLNRPHFSIDVLEVKAETEKAYLVVGRLSAHRTANCCVCGIGLTNPSSVAAGIGPICAEKYGVERVEELNALLLTKFQTSVETWLPKSQIKEVK